jgi:hypothetical protein
MSQFDNFNKEFGILIYNNRGIKYNVMSLGSPFRGMLLSPFGNLTHTSILYYYNILRIMDICNY